MELLGRDVERYVVDQVLGAGGVATVYRARHRQLGSYHAIKVLSLHSEDLKQRLLREGQAQARLRHPNVVPVTDVIDIDGRPALVMDFVDGPSLKAWLATNRMSLGEAVDLFRGIVRGVRAAHASGLVHRDLKPANVLLAYADDEGFVPRVTDFGLVKLVAGHGSDGTLTGALMGTPHYMAPEQIRDASKVDERADLFSLGCILYEMVCGQRPFPQHDRLQVFNAICGGQYVDPRELAPRIPDELGSLIRGLLEVDPDHRLPGCEFVLDLLDQAFPEGGVPVRGTPRTHVGRTPVPAGGEATTMIAPTVHIGQATWWWVGAGVLAVALVLALALALRRPAPLDPEPRVVVIEGDGRAPAPSAAAVVDVPSPSPEPTRPEPVRPAEPVVPGVEAPGPAPVARPPSPRPAPAPVVVPEPEQAPEPEPELIPAVVALTGDAVRVELWANGERVPVPGRVAPGTWTVHAWFPNGDTVEVGGLELSEGLRVELRCAGIARRCVW